MIHRIALTGAQGTGKSTLARAIADQARAYGRTVALYEGLGESVGGGGLALGERAGADSIRAFVRLHHAREAAASAEIQVFDRSLLDTLAYARVLDCLDAMEMKELGQVTIASCRRIMDLLWLRVTTDYPVRNPTDETPEFRRAIDAAIGAIAREQAIRLIEHAIPPERIDDIASAVCEGINLQKRS
jgi:cytidylate kinase